MTKDRSSITSDVVSQETGTQPRPHWLKQGLVHWSAHFLWPAVVVASLVLTGFILLKEYEPEAALDMPALILAHRVSTHLLPSQDLHKDGRESIAIATIGREMFASHFKRQSPLNRCVLADFLKPIFENPHIKTVALDLYVQPNDADDGPCQRKLDLLLQTHSTKAVAIYDDSLPAWPDGQAPNVQFASADFEQVYGIVLKHSVSLGDRPVLGSVVASRLCSLKETTKQPAYCTSADQSRVGFFSGDQEFPSNAIAFEQLGHLYNGGVPISLDDSCLRSEKPDCGIRHVIVGSAYSRDDEHLTPIGTINGVQVHAAIAAQPRIPPDHRWGFAIDIACGALFFGPVSYYFWKRYFSSKLHAPSHHSNSAYLWLVALAFVYCVAVIMLTYFAVHVYAVWGQWISPMPMALGMAFDGMAAASVHVALHQLGAHGHETPALARSSLQRLISAIPRLAAILIVGFASLHVLHILH